MIDLHGQLQQNDRLAITAIAGMGGIGKTELALQYALAQKGEYPAGLCWLRARDQEIATQIVSFAKTKLLLMIPNDLEAKEQVDLIWQRWPEGNTLIVLDDVTDYKVIQPYLPPPDHRFKVLITTRQNFGATVTAINIEELSDEAAIALLKSIVGDERIEAQRGDAQALCKWVGNLPLGLELLGRFLAGKPDWAIAKLLERLESKRLAAKALLETESGMTATLGVAAALELSWAELSQPQQDLACLLGMFAVAPIPWSLVEPCFPEVDFDELEDWRDEGLRAHSLIKRVDQGTYQLHQVVKDFFDEKLEQNYSEKDKKIIKKKLANGILNILRQEKSFTENIDNILHIEAISMSLTDHFPAEEQDHPFYSLGSFYWNKGHLIKAELFCSKYYNICTKELKSNHSHTLKSMHNLANIYLDLEKYETAKPIVEKILECEKNRGIEDKDFAVAITNFARICKYEKNFKEAEINYKKAVEIYEGLDEKALDTATALDNLSFFYREQKLLENAEDTFKMALKIRKFIGSPIELARSYNHISSLYIDQERYKEAKEMSEQSVEIQEKEVAYDNSVTYANSLRNLGISNICYKMLQNKQSFYCEDLELMQKACSVFEMCLGSEHEKTIAINKEYTTIRSSILSIKNVLS